MCKWTKITGNKETWPPNEEDILLTYEYRGTRIYDITKRFKVLERKNDKFPHIKGYASGMYRVYYWAIPSFEEPNV